MPKFYSLEKPPEDRAEKLAQELHEYPELKPRLTFIFPLNENRQRALEMIKSGEIEQEQVVELIKSDDFVEQMAGLYLINKGSNFSEKNQKELLSILEGMNYWDSDIRDCAIQALDRLKSGDRLKSKDNLKPRKGLESEEKNYWLLASQKPLFATPFTKELAERISKIEEIVKNLKNKFKNKFIGLTIFGSTAKGYLKEGSDLDCAIIAENGEVSRYFRNLAQSRYFQKSLGFCDDEDVGKSTLFYGLFFGDHRKLLKLQKKTLENMSEREWDQARKWIMTTEVNLQRAANRFSIEEQKLEKIKQVVALLRVPPSYQETLKIVRSRE